MKTKRISKEELNNLLSYDPKTGRLFWKKRTPEMFSSEDGGRSAHHTCKQWNSRFSGKEALVKNVHGYKGGRINYSYVLAHRIIWKMVTGEEPNEVDHIDGDRSNNRWSNLRDVSSQGNKRNAKLRSDNTSGVVGVTWHSTRKRWCAFIIIDGKCVSLGTFREFEEAVAARKAAEIAHNFHANHGRKVN